MTEEEMKEWKQITPIGQEALEFLKSTLPSHWYEDEETREGLRVFITRMALTYLTQEKRRGFAFDAVGKTKGF